MAESQPSTLSTSKPIVKSNKPVSEALLNDKWDHAISSAIVRSSVGLGFGIIFSVLLFKRRAWPAWVGLGFGAGRAYEEADGMFRRGGSSTAREGLRLVRTQE